MLRLHEERRHSQYGLTGWRLGVLSCTVTAAFVTIANVAFLVAAAPRSVRPIVDGSGTLYTGNCSRVKTVSTWCHFAINILGTLLLGASNYTQQCLVAPTRKEVDEAHRKRKWLDVGVPSFRNLKSIARERVILWIILCLSSVPLHLVYNSVLYAETSANAYNVFAATIDDLNNPEVNFPDPRYSWLRENLGLFSQTLTNAECIKAYANDFVSDRSDVLLVLDAGANDLFNHTSYTGIQGGDPSDTWSVPYSWICEGRYDGRRCDMDSKRVAEDSSNWHVQATSFSSDRSHEKLKVDHCLSRPAEERCSLMFSVPLLVVVIVFNLCKAICMLLTLKWQKDPTLVTLGDAIASFLETPDETTVGHCLLSRTTLDTWTMFPQPKEWKPTKQRWGQACSRSRWVVTILLCTVCIFTTTVVLSIGLSTLASSGMTSISDLWAMGLGNPSVKSLISFAPGGNQTMANMALLANLPQLVLSVNYFGLNCLWTYMLLGLEWNSYAIKRRGLRTTSPLGNQRTTHWLSLPKRYGLPLLAMSALLHWLISQSIYLVRIMVYRDPNRSDGHTLHQKSLTTCGYSAIAVIFSITLGTTLLLLVIAAGIKTLPAAAPRLGACSAVISAACQRPDSDKDAAHKLVRWGALPPHGFPRAHGHCCFTSWEIEELEIDRKYL